MLEHQLMLTVFGAPKILEGRSINFESAFLKIAKL
jgi:hypothetical protein